MVTAQKIGKNLQQARKDAGLTQKEVAARLDMKQQQYSRFECGKYELSYDQILFLCKLYDITPDDLFTID